MIGLNQLKAAAQSIHLLGVGRRAPAADDAVLVEEVIDARVVELLDLPEDRGLARASQRSWIERIVDAFVDETGAAVTVVVENGAHREGGTVEYTAGSRRVFHPIVGVAIEVAEHVDDELAAQRLGARPPGAGRAGV